LGRHKAAIEVFEECLTLEPSDWEVYFFIGLCYKFMRLYDEAIENLKKSKELQRHDQTFLEIARIHQLQQDYQSAVQVCLEGIESSPENTELLTLVGLLYVRMGENDFAF